MHLLHWNDVYSIRAGIQMSKLTEDLLAGRLYFLFVYGSEKYKNILMIPVVVVNNTQNYTVFYTQPNEKRGFKTEVKRSEQASQR